MTWLDRNAWWIVTAIIILGVGGLAWFLIVVLSGHSCVYPYHQVYTGYREQMVGKVMENVDQYNCVHN